MRTSDSTARQSITLMTSAVLLGSAFQAGGQETLPGSDLDLARAKQDARYIVVAEVGKSGDVLGNVPGRISVLMWTELKPSAVLKGEITEDGLNRLPLSIKIEGAERFPKSGEVFVFFIGRPGGSGVITKVMEKTGQNLAAIETAPLPAPAQRVEPYSGAGGIGGPGGSGRNVVPGYRSGGVGGGNLGGGLGGGSGSGASTLNPEPPAYRGTKIVPAREATGELLKVQDEFAAVMARDDPNPGDRKAHFAWLDKNEYVRRYDVRQIGWYGAVLRCKPRAGGGWLVKVVIRPWLDTVSLNTVLSDSVEETYEFVGVRTRLVESNAAIAKPAHQVFPVIW
jgi:hypothetical protein